MKKTEREKELEQALVTLIGYADETSEIWDSGNNDAKIGKRLMAMAGRLPMYDAALNRVHELVKNCNAVYYWCDNCSWKTGDEERVKLLSEAKNLCERLDPNCPVPFGICPMCDCFVYREDEHSRIIDASRELADVVEMLYMQLRREGAGTAEQKKTAYELLKRIGRIEET